MPQVTIRVKAATEKEAIDEAHNAIARTLSDPVPADRDLVNAVRAAYTALSVEEHAEGSYRVVLYGSFSDISRYLFKQTKQKGNV